MKQAIVAQRARKKPGSKLPVQPLHPAEQYARDVLDGKITANKWVKLACQRHFDDFKQGHERGLFFDRGAAERILHFFTLLKHSKGQWAGQPIVLEGWQQFILWVIFGWKTADGIRRFRTAYLEVARKNGKSTIAAGVGLYLAFADQEPGAEVYSAATKRDQARITHSEATRMVKRNKSLKKYIRIFKDSLSLEATDSKYAPLGADSDTLDGLNVHGAIVDELHAHKSREVWDLLQTATGARRQPLMFAITTAGVNRQTICFEQHEHTCQVLDGSIEDDTFFGIIYSIDDNDDWRDEAVWVKANPNLGISKKQDNMLNGARRAAQMTSSLNSFLQRDLNVWVHGAKKWMNMEEWRSCGQIAVDAEALKGRACYAGLDLSSTADLTAWVLVFPPTDEDEYYRVVPRFWCPEDTLAQRVSSGESIFFEAWERAGFVTATPGNVIDYEWIFSQIDKDAKDYDIRNVAFDRWGAARVVQVLQEKGLLMIQFGQGFASMSPPMKDLERLVLSHQLAHGNNPVLTWMADNLVAREDPAGNIKPDKLKSNDRIDGMVALIMALDSTLRNENEPSAYEQHGLRTV